MAEMESRAEDYYDIPTELLPSPNFAGRPWSDITMLDGMGSGTMTFTFSSSSSSASSEDEHDNKEYGPSPRSRSRMETWQSSQPKTPETPAITITAPSGQNTPQRSRSLSDTVRIVEGPQLRRKSQTAPPGTLCPPSFVPAQPRRAISTRLGRSNTSKGRNPQPENRVGRSLDGNKITEQQRQRQRLEKSKPRCSLEATKGSQTAKSFSQKARVKRALDDKQVGRLNTDLTATKSQHSQSAANSILTTPEELYAIPEQRLRNTSLPRHQSRNREAIPLVPPRTTSLSTRQSTQAHDTVEVVSGTTKATWQRRIYLPGPIILEKPPAKPRRDSVATMDAFDASFATKGKRFSDMVGLDNIVMFFENIGVVEEVTAETLDQYWLQRVQGDEGTVNATRLSVEGTPLKSPRKTRSPSGSRFFSSSAPSTGSRIGLRRLLSPALPRSAFLKTPASWGQQTEHS